MRKDNGVNIFDAVWPWRTSTLGLALVILILEWQNIPPNWGAVAAAVTYGLAALIHLFRPKRLSREQLAWQVHNFVTSQPGYQPPESLAGAEWYTVTQADLERITGRKLGEAEYK